MKKIIIGSLSIIILNDFVFCKKLSQKGQSIDKDEDEWMTEAGDNKPGTGQHHQTRKSLYQFGGLHWNSGRTFLLSELGALPSGKEGQFHMTENPVQ